MDSMMWNNYTGYQYHDGDTLSSGDFDWGQVRSADMVLTLQWLYENHPGNQSQLLLDNMNYFHDGGKNWEDWYTQESYLDRGFDKDLNTLPDSLTSSNYAYEHGVNVGQGMVQFSLDSRQCADFEQVSKHQQSTVAETTTTPSFRSQ